MNINKKQLIEQLRYLADNDPKQLKEILNELNVGNMTIEESEAAYEQNIKNKELRELAKESFDRFDKVYKALSWKIMKYLSKKDILFLNKLVVEKYGGNFISPHNLLNESALDYLVEIVEHGFVFGKIMYPTIELKASLYLYNIVENHIFSDGNKITGLLSLDIFLRKKA